MERPQAHPDDLSARLALGEELSGEELAHVERCGRCGEEIRRVEAQIERFRANLAAPDIVPVPAEVDRYIGDLGRQAAARGRRRGRARTVVAWLAPVAAAAGILVALQVTTEAPSLNRAEDPSHRSAETWTAAAPNRDLNRDGQVNIVDALVLARAAELGAASDGWDQNGDGTVDDRDATLIALAAVRLGGSP